MKQALPQSINTKRNDLQCWRALSILAVLLFHIWPEKFPNGYLGVDIFFLISGYLMASIYTFNNDTDDAIVNFYFRRIKRILPIYIAIIGIFMIFLSQKIIFEEYKFILEDSKWAIRLATNLEDLFKKRGYFEAEANFRFFRHCWSLAVEMQFYLIFPFLAITRTCISQRLYQLLLSLLVIISFCYQIFSTNPIVQYESLFCRIWQFCFGMLAQTFPVLSIKFLPSFLLIVCATTIFCPYILSRIYISFASLFLAAAILIMSNAQNDSFKSIIYYAAPIHCITFLGDISYILYLIHWPLITYARFISSENIFSFSDGFLLLSASILCAVVAHFILEKPLIRICHNQQNLLTILFVLYTILIYLPPNLPTKEKLLSEKEEASILTLAFYKNITNFNENLFLPKNWTFKNDISIATKFQRSFMGGIYKCKDKYEIDLDGYVLNYCEIEGNPNATMTALVIGNSFSMNIFAGVSCNPLFFKTYSVWANGLNFPLHNDFERFLIDTKIKVLNPNVTFIVQRYYQKYLYDTPIEQILEHPEFKHWNKILGTIQNHTSAIIMNKEQISFPIDVTQDYIRRRNNNLTIETRLKTPHNSATLEKWLTSLNCSKCGFFDYREAFCDRYYCNIVDNITGLPLYRDKEHISPIGLRYLKPLIDSAINETLKIHAKI